jgi:hypothetical protein
VRGGGGGKILCHVVDCTTIRGFMSTPPNLPRKRHIVR